MVTESIICDADSCGRRVRNLWLRFAKSELAPLPFEPYANFTARLGDNAEPLAFCGKTLCPALCLDCLDRWGFRSRTPGSPPFQSMNSMPAACCLPTLPWLPKPDALPSSVFFKKLDASGLLASLFFFNRLIPKSTRSVWIAGKREVTLMRRPQIKNPGRANCGRGCRADTAQKGQTKRAEIRHRLKVCQRQSSKERP